MVKKTLLAAALSLGLAGPALAENCADTTWSALVATSCLGSFIGNSGSGSTVPGELAFLDAEWIGPFSFLGKSDDASNGPFTSNPGVSFDGTLTFDTPIEGRFVISLKAARNYSYYLFDAAAPVSSLTYSSTAGVALNNNDIPQELSHASLFAAPVTPIPEPSALALALIGVPALWMVARRRKQNL